MNDKKVYTLFVDRYFLQIKNSHKAFQNKFVYERLDKLEENSVIKHNENYFISYSRKELVKTAEKIAKEWKQELEDNLNKVNDILSKGKFDGK